MELSADGSTPPELRRACSTDTVPARLKNDGLATAPPMNTRLLGAMAMFTVTAGSRKTFL
ncbi:hypothetical protein D3C85_1861710 [compost metagenome]